MNSTSVTSKIGDRMVPLTSIGLLPIAWGLAIAATIGLALSFHGKSEFFYGIVGTREQVISFQYPVEIVQIHAVEGKSVGEGQALLEVRRHDLAVGQETLDERIRRFDLEKKETTNTLGSQVKNLAAKREAALADLDGQIHALERKLRALDSVLGHEQKPELASSADSLELRDLQQKRRFTDQAISAEIGNLKSQLSGASRPIDAQIAELQKTKTETVRQADALRVAALFDGRVSSINFRIGELVPAYQPIASVQGLAPRDVKGYVHENVLNEVKIGQTVWVRSITPEHAGMTLEATVEGLGNRIVEYPLRLRRNQAVTAYGREVVVKLKAETNPLLFGEKVEVALAPRREWPNLLTSAHAKAAATDGNSLRAAAAKGGTPATAQDGVESGLQLLNSNSAAVRADLIEASGLWWNAKESHYLVVSDESHGRGPAIFVVDKNMRVEQQLKMLQPTTTIDDLESISSDGDYVYVLSSMSFNKQDKLKAKRKKLLRMRYQGHQVSEQQEIDLHDVLLRLSQDQPSSQLGTFLTAALRDKSLNVESHFVRSGKLYIGFKSPQAPSGATVIAELDSLAALFAGQKVNAQVWAQIALVDPQTQQAARLSDMTWVNDKLVLLSVSGGSPKRSQLWSYAAGDRQAKLLKQLDGVAAEGVAYRPDNATLTVVFDEGYQAPSKYQTWPLSVLQLQAQQAKQPPQAATANGSRQ
jgi:multidrug resistance efflux pump